MSLKALEYTIWVISSLTLFATAIQLRRRGLTSHLPVFFTYLLIVGTHGLLNLALSFLDPVSWFYSFFVGSFLTTLLGFAVLYEVARSAISTPAFKLNASSFALMCAIGAVIALFVSANTEVAGHTFVRARVILEAVLRVMQVSILAVFAAVSFFFGLWWRRVEFGIVLGYGLYACAQLSVMYLRAAGAGNETLYVFVPLISYSCAAVIWLIYSRMMELSVNVDLEPLITEVRQTHVAIERLQ